MERISKEKKKILNKLQLLSEQQQQHQDVFMKDDYLLT